MGDDGGPPLLCSSLVIVVCLSYMCQLFFVVARLRFRLLYFGADPDGGLSPSSLVCFRAPSLALFQPLNLLVADDGSCVVMDVGSACPARREVGGAYGVYPVITVFREYVVEAGSFYHQFAWRENSDRVGYTNCELSVVFVRGDIAQSARAFVS